MFTDAYLEPSRTSVKELFFLRLSHIFTNVFNSIKLPLGSICYKTHPFVKTCNRENYGRKSLANNGTIFFRNSKLHNGMASSQKNE